MTPLRRRMQEELQRRNYSEATAVCYVRHVAEFAQFFRRSPDSLGAEEIKQFQLHLIHQKKVSWSTYIQATAALRFFYIKTLGQAFMAEKIPFPKRPRFLPTVLSQDEVRRLLDATTSLKHRALFMALYGSGLRVSEACHLAIADIDSSRMVIHVRQGKGQKDRDVMLSPVLLDALRQYCRHSRPKGWLFPGNSADKPITTKAVFLMIRKSAARAKLTKTVSPHVLRHASAYYTTFPTLFILKTIGLGQARSGAVYGPRGPLSPVAVRPAMPSPSGRLSTEHTLPHASPVEYVLG